MWSDARHSHTRSPVGVSSWTTASRTSRPRDPDRAQVDVIQRPVDREQVVAVGQQLDLVQVARVADGVQLAHDRPVEAPLLDASLRPGAIQARLPLGSSLASTGE